MKKLKNKKSRPATPGNCRRVLQLSGLVVATSSLVSGAFTAKAIVYSGSELVTPNAGNGNNASALFGTLLNQNDLDDNYPTDPVSGDALGSQACVPTAVAQGLTYLDNYQTKVLGNATPFTYNPDSITEVSDLATAMGTRNDEANDDQGTTYPGRVNGTTTYLSRTGANPSTAYVVGGQYARRYSTAGNIGPTRQSFMRANSTAQFLASGLNAHDGVEFAILWGSLSDTGVYTKGDGGHFLTLESISYNSVSGTGTIVFIDPNTASVVDGTLTKTTAGNIYVSYPAPPGTPDDGEDEETTFGDNLDGGGSDDGGIIVNDLEETVPDGGLTAGLLGASVLGLLALRRRYSFSV
jgi:hypothetical protein